jgi:uncharacterized protein (TIGR02145 family)
MNYNIQVNGNTGNIRGICSAGWHIPADDEWTQMINYLGGSSIAGSKVKEAGTLHWDSPNAGTTNESCFTALPGGYRGTNGSNAMGDDARFWSSGQDPYDKAGYLRLYYSFPQAEHGWTDAKGDGYSVRCMSLSRDFGYLTVTDENLNPVSDMNFYGQNSFKNLLLINQGTGKTLDVSSISTENSVFKLNHSSVVLSPGDSTLLKITFNSGVKNIYPDTLKITSDDPYNPLIIIPLNGTFPPELSLTDSTNISCYGYSDGTATVTPSLGTPPYKYQWDDPAGTTSSKVTGLSTNFWYHVIVTDSLEWTVKDSVLLSQPEPLSVHSDYSEFICPHTSNGFINLIPEGGTPPYSYLWFTGVDTSDLTGLSAGNYDITITDSHGCEDFENFVINNAYPVTSEKICIVTVDLLSGKNIIVWEKTPDAGIASYNLYREAGIEEYEQIGSKTANELSIFRDETADPESRAYLYKITITDTCGNESDLKNIPYHKPSFLQFVSYVGGVNLTWTNYEIEGIDNIGEYLSSYVIYRGTESTGLTEYQTVGSINNFTDKDPDALVRRYYYRVAGTLKNPCYPSSGKKDEPGPYNRSMSNIEDNRLAVGLDKLSVEKLSINPVPFSDRTVITFGNPNGYPYTLYLMDLSGKVCRIVDNICTTEYTLEREDLGAGFYMVELRGDKVYRGRIIVE